ncbi:AAA family ATPase [Streptomyces sp. NBC_00386]|uniref:AAA family ATPase n=1 Tax=Streptomyces sp. NBC_00386 TaxID=2975734 RepID=UPI002E1F9665
MTTQLDPTRFCVHPVNGRPCDMTEATHAGGQLGHHFTPPTADLWHDDEAEREPESQASRRSWRAQDLSSFVDGTHKPALPTVGARADGVGVLYPGRMNSIAAESEAGKTWLALVLVLQELNRGNHVVYQDFEDEAAGVVGRLLNMGADIGDVLERFHYIRPEEPLSAVDLMDLGEVLRLRPTLAVVDGVTEGMSLHGLNINDNKDVAVFGRRILRPLQEAGPAVLTLDHVVKSADSRGRYAIGGVHKLNGLNGVMYLMENVKPFGIGVKGKSRVRVAKDRPGRLRKESLPHESGLYWFADLVVDATEPGLVEAVLYAPNETGLDAARAAREDAEGSRLQQEVVAAIQRAPGPLTTRDIEDRVKGRGADIRAATAALVDAKRIVVDPGPRGSKLHRLPDEAAPEEGAA